MSRRVPRSLATIDATLAGMLALLGLLIMTDLLAVGLSAARW